MREPSAGEPIVEFRTVDVTLNGTSILQDVSLQVGVSETVVLLGRSGAGKSTALRLVNRLLVPTRGSVQVFGRDIREWDPIPLRRRIGYMIQQVGLFPHFNVAQNVGLVPRLLGWDEARVERRVTELLELVGLAPERYRKRYPRELSGGQQQRVGVARALAADPPLLLCDEPFGALDPMTRAELQAEFRRLSRGLRKSLLFVTHDLREALLLADRICLLEEGRVRFLGTAAQFQESTDPAIRAFLAPAAAP